MKIHLGISSEKDSSVRIFNYASNILQNFNDQNYTYYSSGHPQIDSVVYMDKLW
jgi:hypothetical protein